MEGGSAERPWMESGMASTMVPETVVRLMSEMTSAMVCWMVSTMVS